MSTSAVVSSASHPHTETSLTTRNAFEETYWALNRTSLLWLTCNQTQIATVTKASNWKLEHHIAHRKGTRACGGSQAIAITPGEWELFAFSQPSVKALIVWSWR